MKKPIVNKILNHYFQNIGKTLQNSISITIMYLLKIKHHREI